MTLAVRRVGRLVDVVQQQCRLARLQVAHFDAVGEARCVVDHVALHAGGGQCRVVQAEQVAEGFG